MAARWEVASGDIWFIIEDEQIAGTDVRLTNRDTGDEGGKMWRYTLDIHKEWLKPVPAHMQDLPLDELKAWVMAMWRMQ